MIKFDSISSCSVHPISLSFYFFNLVCEFKYVQVRSVHQTWFILFPETIWSVFVTLSSKNGRAIETTAAAAARSVSGNEIRSRRPHHSPPPVTSDPKPRTKNRNSDGRSRRAQTTSVQPCSQQVGRIFHVTSIQHCEDKLILSFIYFMLFGQDIAKLQTLLKVFFVFLYIELSP